MEVPKTVSASANTVAFTVPINMKLYRGLRHDIKESHKNVVWIQMFQDFFWWKFRILQVNNPEANMIRLDTCYERWENVF